MPGHMSSPAAIPDQLSTMQCISVFRKVLETLTDMHRNEDNSLPENTFSNGDLHNVWGTVSSLSP